MIELVLIHHGLTEGIADERFIGATDEPLSPSGIATLHGRRYPAAGLVFCSPEKRCVQTAEILYPAIKAIAVELLRECHYGAFENKTYHEVKRNPAYYNWINSGGKMPFPDGEGRPEFIERTMGGLREVLAVIKRRKQKRAALVISGGPIMGIMSKLALPPGDYYDFQIPHGEGYVLQLNENIFSGLSDTDEMVAKANNHNDKNYAVIL